MKPIEILKNDILFLQFVVFMIGSDVIKLQGGKFFATVFAIISYMFLLAWAFRTVSRFLKWYSKRTTWRNK